MSILGMLLLMGVPAFASLGTPWEKHICEENRERLVNVMKAEMAKDEAAGSGLVKSEAEYFRDCSAEYQLDCPNEGVWELEGSGDSLSVSCYECENLK